MTRAFGIVGAAFVVALALTPRSADAQLIAGAEFQCVSPQLSAAGAPIAFQQSPGSVSFGGSITLNANAGGQFFTFARTGVYQVHLDGLFVFFGTSSPAIQGLLNGVAVAQWPSWRTLITVAGDRLISANAGDVFALVPNTEMSLQQPPFSGSCELVIMQVQSPPPTAPPPPVTGSPPVTWSPIQPGAPSAPSIVQWSRRPMFESR